MHDKTEKVVAMLIKQVLNNVLLPPFFMVVINIEQYCNVHLMHAIVDKHEQFFE